MLRLSSILVPLIKLTPVFLALCAAITLLEGTDEYSVSRAGLLLASGLVLLIVVRRWKSVFLRGNRLYIAGLRTTIEVPLRDVAAIEIVGARRIALRFRRPTPFGPEIYFIGRLLGFRTPAIAHELAYLVRRARTMHPGRPRRLPHAA